MIRTEELNKTDNDRIFVEKDKPLSMAEIEVKLKILRDALDTESNRRVKQALMEVVPTYHKPDEVNEKATESQEMKMAGSA